jgi:mannosylglycerate hydrolase
MNGVDHAPPDAHTAEVAEALAAATGWNVTRGLFDDFVDGLEVGDAEHHGELVGGRLANLLPGVWSSRLHLKLADRATEAALVGWAEPWAAFGRAFGLTDERPSLRLAWRELLVNQAHDSIGGCSVDAVHEQMEPRYANAVELARETTGRVLERLAGLPTDRALPWTDEIDLAVFNPSPFPRTDVVRFPLDGVPTFLVTDDNADIHPLAVASLMRQGFTVDDQPVRMIPSDDPSRFRVLPEQVPADLEFVVADIPAFGWRRLHLAPADASPDHVDDEPTITIGDLSVTAETDGTLTVQMGERRWTQLGAVEDLADSGDTYDFDALPDDQPITEPVRVEVVRRLAPTGVAELGITRTFALPVGLTADRRARADATVDCKLETTVRIAPGVERIDLDVKLDNAARDHRLRLLFPTAARVDTFRAATTFDSATRSTELADDRGWQHRAPATFPQQGWIAAGGLTVGAPGLPEAEVTKEGTIAVTLLRSVGSLSRLDLRSRPVPAGPGHVTPEAQCLGPIAAPLSLFAGDGDPAVVRSAELGLRAVPAGDQPLLPDGASLLALDGAAVLSALKPAESGDGFVVRLLNPTDDSGAATLRFGLPIEQLLDGNLDETPRSDVPLEAADGVLTIDMAPHRLRTILVSLGS